MAHIVPALLEETKQSFDDKVFAVTRIVGVDRIQVDFGDGAFVPHTTVSVADLDPLNPAFHWEAHVMMTAPADFLDYKIAGFSTVIIHYEAYPNAGAVSDASKKISEHGLIPGLALNPETEAGRVLEFKDQAKQFTLLSVHPGFQGGSFVPESYERLKIWRNLLPDGIIEIDGGMTEQTIGEAIASGADLVVVGHALLEAESLQVAYDMLSGLGHVS